MLTRFVEDQHTNIILSNTGTSYQLKQQLTSDIASVLYNLPMPERKGELVFTLINSIVEGNFETKMESLEVDPKEIVIEESALSALGFELLWAGLGNESIQLFGFINKKFENSSKAKENLDFACQHRLARSATNKLIYCK